MFVQLLAVVSHAKLRWQSVLAEHPQKFGVAPPGTMHLEPALVFTQSKQLPDVPHAVFWFPVTQVPPEQQKPPPQTPSAMAPQRGVHAPAVQVGVPLAQVTHAPPEPPHSAFARPDWHVLPLQQPPLHAE